jgi:low affinity Fe/Cu permease
VPTVAAAESSNGHAANELVGEVGQFRRLSQRLTEQTGSPMAAVLVVGAATVWLIVGVLTHFPRWLELLATVGVPFLTLLMVVMLQHTQNHDARATQLKLDELIRASHDATNRMMTVEDASAEDLERIHQDFHIQAESAAPDV